jgi:hypothetical protein
VVSGEREEARQENRIMCVLAREMSSWIRIWADRLAAVCRLNVICLDIYSILNKKNYDEMKFTNAGMKHLAQFDLEGS